MSTLKGLNFFVETMETKGIFSLEIIINILVRTFWFIWIPMLWVSDRYKYVYSYSAEIDFRRLKVDPRTVRVKHVMC